MIVSTWLFGVLPILVLVVGMMKSCTGFKLTFKMDRYKSLTGCHDLLHQNRYKFWDWHVLRIVMPMRPSMTRFPILSSSWSWRIRIIICRKSICRLGRFRIWSPTCSNRTSWRMDVTWLRRQGLDCGSDVFKPNSSRLGSHPTKGWNGQEEQQVRHHPRRFLHIWEASFGSHIKIVPIKNRCHRRWIMPHKTI